MQIFDITIPLNQETPVWEGDRGVSITQTAFIDKGSDYNISRIEMGVHAGTHIDAPKHLFSDKNTIDKTALTNLIGPVHVIQIPDGILRINPNHLIENGYLGNEKRILLKTQNSKIWKEDPLNFHTEFAAITTECAQFLADGEIVFAGIDYFSISPFDNLKPPHEILLSKSITILENADLSGVAPGFYELYCLPLKITGTDGAPVRTVLIKSLPK